eukprot:CAMPEP_0119474438 /NCGR_PEP_ID=MMETSP1344-20130328/5693_1 /TAXON_ID=236787 /ORGANISM="Florenciella parvula, Strain CCMP2471" /LENGTH=75 /DNA_ID=CAMNT_0007507733 /DNA_START=302 /DNA_END=529 /DNA_ORIENTATION=-
MTYDNTTGKGPPVRVDLPPRALQLVTGEARYEWRHAIRLEDLSADVRLSITFRMSGGHELRPKPICETREDRPCG